MIEVRKLESTKDNTLGEKLMDFRATIKSLVEEVGNLQQEILRLREELSHKKNL